MENRRPVIDSTLHGAVTAIQAALSDMREAGRGTILLTAGSRTVLPMRQRAINTVTKKGRPGIEFRGRPLGNSQRFTSQWSGRSWCRSGYCSGILGRIVLGRLALSGVGCTGGPGLAGRGSGTDGSIGVRR